MLRARSADQATTPGTLVSKPNSMMEGRLVRAYTLRCMHTMHVPPAVVAAAREREGAQASEAVLGCRVGHP